jgi:hypothetical protein
MQCVFKRLDKVDATSDVVFYIISMWKQRNLEKMDALQSFTEPHSVTVPNDNIEQDGIPRIIKGPSSVTAMDGGEIVLKWNILGNYYVTFY